MSLGGPNIYPGVLSWLGMARELTAGTPLVPVVTQPLDQADYSPEDMPHFLDDKAIRGSMTDLFYKTLGVEQGTFSFGAPNFLDTQGYWFDNVFGDVSTIGSNGANPATVSGGIAVGATSLTLAAAPPSQYTAGATIQIRYSQDKQYAFFFFFFCFFFSFWGGGGGPIFILFKLIAIEPTLSSATFVAEPTVTASSYKFEIQGSATTQKFAVERTTAGALNYTCVAVATGGCPTGGNWGSERRDRFSLREGAATARSFSLTPNQTLHNPTTPKEVCRNVSSEPQTEGRRAPLW